MPTLATGPPVVLELDAPLEVARWRPLVHWLLAFPHWIWSGILGFVLSVLSFVAFWTILFTKKIPAGIFDLMVGIQRYQWRVLSYAMALREDYPSFNVPVGPADPGGDPARLSVTYPEEMSRFLPLVKWLAAIPHFIVLMFLMMAAYFVTGIGALAVLFTGRWPEGLRNFIVGVSRWGVRVNCYIMLLTDAYPPFALA
jgi:hypothetical protein